MTSYTILLYNQFIKFSTPVIQRFLPAPLFPGLFSPPALLSFCNTLLFCTKPLNFLVVMMFLIDLNTHTRNHRIYKFRMIHRLHTEHRSFS